ELADDKKWESSPLLQEDKQQELLAEIERLASFAAYDERRRQRAQSGEEWEAGELRQVQFRRLRKTLEVIVLAKNLALVAAPEIVERYREMLVLEDSSLTSQAR